MHGPPGLLQKGKHGDLPESFRKASDCSSYHVLIFRMGKTRLAGETAAQCYNLILYAYRLGTWPLSFLLLLGRP